jgi:hypothetical protein
MQRKYLARAKDWALSETSKGDAQIVVYFEISTPEAEMAAITWYGYFSEKAWERTVESLRHCGWQGADLTDLSGLGDKEVELVIEDEEYDGKVRPKVRWINKPGAMSIKAPLAGDRAKAFAAQMKDRIKALDAAAGKPKAQPKRAPAPHIGANGGPPPLSDDDINF